MHKPFHHFTTPPNHQPDMMKPAFLFDGRGILDGQSLDEIGFNLFRIGK
jgi:hypothetical protein